MNCWVCWAGRRSGGCEAGEGETPGELGPELLSWTGVSQQGPAASTAGQLLTTSRGVG